MASVLTTGEWILASNCCFATGQDVYLVNLPNNAQSMSGAMGTPDRAHGDEELVVDFDTGTAPNRSTGFAKISVDLTGGSLSAATTNWGTTSTSFSPSSSDSTIRQTRLNKSTVLGTALYAKPSSTTPIEIIAGVIPNTQMPSMTIRSASGGFDDTPVLLPLAHYFSFVSPVAFANPFTSADEPTVDKIMPEALLYRVIHRRPLLPASNCTIDPPAMCVDSGFQELVHKTGAVTVDYPVGIASAVSFAGMPLDNVADGSTMIPLPASGFADLAFSIDGGTMTTDCTATLYHVTTTLDPLRTFLVIPAATATQTPVRVSTDQLQSGETYAFGIACTDQHPGAKDGDLSTIGPYPVSGSQLFPATFKMM